MYRVLAILLLLAVPSDAAVKRLRWNHTSSTLPPWRIPQFILVDLETELPVFNVAEGDSAYAKDTDKLFKRTATTWVEVGAGGGGGTPSGTGFRHVIAGVEDAAAKLVDTADINNAQVTFAKIEPIGADRLLGRQSGVGSGDIQTLTVTSPLSLAGGSLNIGSPVGISIGGTGQTTATAAFDALAPCTTTGGIIYFNGTDHVCLTIGVGGQFLGVNDLGGPGTEAPAWQTPPGGGGGLTLSTVEKDLGTVAKYSGTFDITGLSGLTIGRPVMIFQSAGPYTGKGTLEDEAEMDQATVTGYVFSSTIIRVYWTAQPHSGPMMGNVKFSYAVG